MKPGESAPPASEPLSIRQLEVFVALVERGSFTKAARHLRLSQSTVSGHISDLERRLDVRLVGRDRSGVRPTAAGTALLRPAREVLKAERGARMAIEELSGLLKGQLLVGGSTIPSSYLLPALFARFHHAYPGVALQLVTGDSREILDRVVSADLEIGVVGAAPGKRDLISDKIGEDNLVLVAPPTHPLAEKRPLALADIAAAPLVMREEGSGTRTATEKALRKLAASESGPDLNIACQVGSTEAMCAAVRHGLGMAFVSSLAVAEDLASGRLVALKLKGFEVRRPLLLVSRPEHLVSPAALAFRTLALEGR